MQDSTSDINEYFIIWKDKLKGSARSIMRFPYSQVLERQKKKKQRI